MLCVCCWFVFQVWTQSSHRLACPVSTELWCSSATGSGTEQGKGAFQPPQGVCGILFGMRHDNETESQYSNVAGWLSMSGRFF